jgi:hypothetical protein
MTSNRRNLPKPLIWPLTATKSLTITLSMSHMIQSI